MKLEVANIHWADVYKDMARIPELHRNDIYGENITEGDICEVSIGENSVFLSVRGQTEHNNPAIHLDERTRNKLGVKIGETVEVKIRSAEPIEKYRWVLSASDPAYRLASQVALISLAVSLVGMLVGIVSIYIALR
jgi:ribosomal protein S1